MRKIMVVPCIVNSSLYCAAVSKLPFGPASWSRSSSASTPPITRKASAVVPYMMPIFLWSIVVNQLQKPVVDCGRRSTRRRRAGARTVSETVVIGDLPRVRSLQLEQVVGDLHGLLLRHRRLPGRSIAAERRHAHTLARRRLPRLPARLGLHRDEARRVVHPFDELVACQLVVAAGEGGATAQVGQVRSVAAHLRVGERVAVRALELRADEVLSGTGGVCVRARGPLGRGRRGPLVLPAPPGTHARVLGGDAGHHV